MCPAQPSSFLNLQACPVASFTTKSCANIQLAIGVYTLNFPSSLFWMLDKHSLIYCGSFFFSWRVTSYRASATCHMSTSYENAKCCGQKNLSFLWTSAGLTQKGAGLWGWSAVNCSRKTIFWRGQGTELLNWFQRPKGQLNPVTMNEQNKRQGIIMAIQKLWSI